MYGYTATCRPSTSPANGGGARSLGKNVTLELDASALPADIATRRPHAKRIITMHGVRSVEDAIEQAKSRTGWQFDHLSVQQLDTYDGHLFWLRVTSLDDLAQYPAKRLR